MEPIDLVAQDHMRAQAKQNMRKRFLDNPCRGLVLGMDCDGNHVQLCWIMGRSENSQNRIYVVEGDMLQARTTISLFDLEILRYLKLCY